jgi:hypothetical protein
MLIQLSFTSFIDCFFSSFMVLDVGLIYKLVLKHV